MMKLLLEDFVNCISSYIVRVMKWRSLVLSMWGKNAYLILVRKLEWKGRLERPKCRMKENIKWDQLSTRNTKVWTGRIWPWIGTNGRLLYAPICNQWSFSNSW